jgi:DNA-binding NarL/FixJ family response regulator
MNVFVIEDAPQVRKRIVAMLHTIDGVTVVGEASSVRDGVAGLLASDARVLLLDLQLEDGNGLEVLAAIKPQRPDLRVIVLSNLANQQYREASALAGAEVFLDKSNEFARLPSLLRGWLDKSQAAGIQS